MGRRLAVVTVLAVVGVWLMVPGVAAAALAKPHISFAPQAGDSANYGGVFVGDDSKSQTFILTNDGGRATSRLTVSLNGSSAYTKTADTCSGKGLKPGLSCSVTVKFAPTTPGTATTSLVAVNLNGNVRASIGLAGQGVPGVYVLQWSPPVYDFGPTSTGVLFRAINLGNRPIWFTSGGQIPSPDPFLIVNQGQYQQCLIAHQDGVPGATALAVGASCDIIVQHVAPPCPIPSFVTWSYRYFTDGARTTTAIAQATALGSGLPCP